MVEDDSYRLNYDPTTPIPPLTDHNLSNYPLHHLHGFASAVIEQGLVAYLQGAIATKDEAIVDYCKYAALYRLKVIFPDQVREWNFIFQHDGFQLAKGSYPKAPDSNYSITASALLELCEGKKSVWAIRPETRRWSRLLAPTNTVLGLRTLEVELQNPLTLFILSLWSRKDGETEALMKYYGLVQG